jgi:phosphoribosylformylglycinamidine synthase
VVGTVGLLEDRARAVPMRWRDGDEIWLLGEMGFTEAALAASEHACLRGRRGGMPALDLDAAARLVSLLPRLAADRLVAGLHDLSVGGLGVAAARLAIASRIGARISVGDAPPTAALFGERGGRVLAAVAPEHANQVAAACHASAVRASRLGRAGGGHLELSVGGVRLEAGVADLAAAWERSR